jgi:hypothetical protein
VEFELGATFLGEENEKVERVIRAEMEVDRQELEQSQHAPKIAPGEVRKEFPYLEVGYQQKTFPSRLNACVRVDALR